MSAFEKLRAILLQLLTSGDSVELRQKIAELEQHEAADVERDANQQLLIDQLNTRLAALESKVSDFETNLNGLVNDLSAEPAPTTAPALPVDSTVPASTDSLDPLAPSQEG